MANHKKTLFRSVEQIFKAYIPDYVPPHMREPSNMESQGPSSLSSELTNSLLNKFKKSMGLCRSSQK